MAIIKYNMMCFNRKAGNGKLEARCQCKPCRMNRALDKEDPEEVKQKRIERAREIVRTQNELR